MGLSSWSWVLYLPCNWGTWIFLGFFIFIKWFTITEKPSPWWFEGVGIWYVHYTLDILLQSHQHCFRDVMVWWYVIGLIFKINTFRDIISEASGEILDERLFWDSPILGEYNFITCFSIKHPTTEEFLTHFWVILFWWQSFFAKISNDDLQNYWSLFDGCFFCSIKRKHQLRNLLPWKLTMSPENQWLEDVLPTEIVLFFWKHVTFSGEFSVLWLADDLTKTSAGLTKEWGSGPYVQEDVLLVMAEIYEGSYSFSCKV